MTVAFAALVGFLGGLLSFKVKARWCSTCGAVKRCPECLSGEPVLRLIKRTGHGHW
jgi:hypothetical protein